MELRARLHWCARETSQENQPISEEQRSADSTGTGAETTATLGTAGPHHLGEPEDASGSLAPNVAPGEVCPVFLVLFFTFRRFFMQASMKAKKTRQKCRNMHVLSMIFDKVP